MKPIDKDFFCREIKYAHVICSVEHGYIVATRKENPYSNQPFRPHDNSSFYFWECEWGSMLKLTEDGITKLLAFRVSSFQKHDLFDFSLAYDEELCN